MNNMLDDNNYTLVGNCPLSKLQRSSNQLVKRLHEEKVIDNNTRLRMTRDNTNLPRIYALPKVHKAGAPLRPIVDYCDSPGSGLAVRKSNPLN